MRRLLLPLPLIALVSIAVTCPASADAARREHTVHGTVRKLCDTVQMRKWPGGPAVGLVSSGQNLRRYNIERRWALAVTRPGRRPVLRGYVLVHAFCAPSARGRRAAAAARRLANARPRGRRGTPLARPLLRRICSQLVYLRDRPLNRAIALLYVGDTFRATRRARNPWFGGFAYGHAMRKGWVPRSALCSGRDRRAEGHRPVPGPARRTVLAPPALLSCGARVSGRSMLQIGVRGPAPVTVELRDDRGAVVSSARFARGLPGRWEYAVAGPYECGRSFAVVYAAGGAETVFAVRVTATPPAARAASAAARPATKPAARAASAVPPPGAPHTRAATHAAAVLAGAVGAVAAHGAPHAAPQCRSKPQRRFAHGNSGTVGHYYHARPAISADGRYVAFAVPGAGLVAGDRNRAPDIFVRDTVGGRTRLVSVALDGGVGNATSRAAAISAGGEVVAFESDASNLVAGDRDGVRDIFVRDLRAGVTRRIAAGRSAALSADGRRVAFEQAGEVYVADTHGSAARRVARAAYRPELSADGRYVAYETTVAHTSRDANRNWDVYRTQLAGGDTVLLSAGPDGRSGRGASHAAVLNGDGSVAAFQSDAPLVRGDATRLRDILVRDIGAQRTTLVSANRCGRPADGYSRYPAISADGRRVAFDSHATDLVRGAPRGRGQVYLRDLGTRRTRVVSITPMHHPSSRTSFSPALAARAAIVAFPSFAYDLGPRDGNRRVDIYRRSIATGRTQRISKL